MQCLDCVLFWTIILIRSMMYQLPWNPPEKWWHLRNVSQVTAMAVSRRGNCLLVGGGDGAVRKRISAAASRRSRSGPTQSIGQSVSPSTYQRTKVPTYQRTNVPTLQMRMLTTMTTMMTIMTITAMTMTTMKTWRPWWPMAMAMAKWKGKKMK